MRFVVVGAGGVGGYLGARLAESGHQVAWLVRGRTHAALVARGLVLRSPSGELRLPPQSAADEAAELARRVGPIDALVVTTKLYDLAELAPRLAPLVTERTRVLPLQNGVESHVMLAAHLPAHAVLKGTVAVKSHVAAPGEIVAKSDFCKVRFGPGHPSQSLESLAALRDALDGAKAVSAVLTDTIELDLWRKFVMLASFSAIACMARATIGQIRDDPRAMALAVAAAEEGARVARARGVPLDDDIAALVDAQTRDMPKDGRPSMLEDLEAGRPLELEFLSGAVVRLGGAADVPTPIHATALAALAMHARGRADRATAAA